MSTITFIGKTNAGEYERDALDFIGAILAKQQVELVTTPRGDSNTALIAGYEAHGGVANTPKNVLATPTDQLIVYADEQLLEALTKHNPNWRKTNSIVIESEDELFNFLDILLANLTRQAEEAATQTA